MTFLDDIEPYDERFRGWMDATKKDEPEPPEEYDKIQRADYMIGFEAYFDPEVSTDGVAALAV